MLVIGIAGGVASGKSLVTDCFQHFGATVFDGDRIGHEVLQQTVLIQQIVDHFGDGILCDGQIDRSRLAHLVFAKAPEGPSALKKLEAITHPKIGEQIMRKLELARQDPNCQACVLDAPVMFKAGWDKLCNKLVFVDAPLEIRKNRAAERGWDNNELAKREANQISVEKKRELAGDIIDNSHTKETTFQQAAKMWLAWGLNLPRELQHPSSLFIPKT